MNLIQLSKAIVGQYEPRTAIGKKLLSHILAGSLRRGRSLRIRPKRSVKAPSRSPLALALGFTLPIGRNGHTRRLRINTVLRLDR